MTTTDPLHQPDDIRDPHPHVDLTVCGWHDQLVEAHPESHPTASDETLVWWTPSLGPTATLMVHRFATYLRDRDEMSFAPVDLARTFGMGQSLSRVRNALARLERFGLVATHGHTVYVRLTLPPLTSRQLDQLPHSLRDLSLARRSAIHTTTPPS